MGKHNKATKTQTFIIKADDIKVSKGHQGNTHQIHDNRPRRLRTRKSIKTQAIREFF